MSLADKATPLPAAIMAPWLEDNARFMQELQKRDASLNYVALREKYKDQIRLATSCAPCSLGAVDAASVMVPFGDQMSILIQVVAVDGMENVTLDLPKRVTGIDSHELRLATTPMRVAAECVRLANASEATIADTSYWSFLMEVNQAITHNAHSAFAPIEDAVKTLVDDHAFINMAQNTNIIAMSKTSEAATLMPDVSDRHVLSHVLEAGEYFAPRSLTAGTSGAFGIEKRRFKVGEREMLETLFKKHLSVAFYKPHAWTRAFRIEGHRERLEDRAWLMSLLSAISGHTADNRMVIEPWPQFIADYTAKQLSAVAKLYGEMNWHRHPNANYLKTRTRKVA